MPPSSNTKLAVSLPTLDTSSDGASDPLFNQGLGSRYSGTMPVAEARLNPSEALSQALASL